MFKHLNARRILKTRSWLTLGAVAISLAAGLYFSRSVWASNIVWDNGGGVDQNWSNPLNWSGDVVPGAGDVAVFDTASGSATIDAGFAGSVGGIDIRLGYSGTITHSSGTTLTVGGSGFSQVAGTFTGGTGNIDINGRLIFSGGDFTASSNTTSVQAFSLGAGTFHHNNGTFVLDGTGDFDTSASPAVTLNNLTIDKAAGFFTLGGSFIVTGTLNLNNGLFLAGGPIDAKGAVTILPTFNSGNCLLTISGPAARTITFAASLSLPNTTLNAPNVTLGTSGSGALTWPSLTLQTGTINQGGVNFVINGAYNQSGGTFNGSSNTITINSTFTQSNGTFTGGTGNIDINGRLIFSGGVFTASSNTTSVEAFNLGAGTFNHNNGTFVLDGNNDVDTSVSPTVTLNNLTINKTGGSFFTLGGSFIVTGTLTLTDGLWLSGGPIQAQGAVNVGPNFDGGSGQLAITGSATRTITLAAGASLVNVTLNAPNVTVQTSGSGTLNWKALTVQNGTINQGGADFVFSDTYTQSGGTFNGSSNTITINSTFTQSNGTFTGDSGDIGINGPLNFSGGTFTASSNTTSMERFALNGGVFNHNGGTFVLDGNNDVDTSVSPTVTLNNLTINKTGGSFFTLGGSFIVTGTLTLTDGAFLSGGPIQAQGAVNVGANFDGGGGQLTFSGGFSQTFTNSGGLNPTGTWTINKTASKVTLASNLILNGGQPLNITSGTLDQGASFNLQTSNTLNIGASGTLRDFGTGDLTLGGNLINNGIFNFNGGGTGCSDPNGSNPLLIRSSAAGTQRAWSGGGAFSVVDVDVQDQDASAIAPGITAFGSSVINNSPGWTTNSGCPIAVTTQPNNVSACPGSPASFTVAVSGTGPTFQWRKNGTPLSDGGNISGALSATLTINPVSAADVASTPGYDAVGSNAFGVTAASNPAALSLNTAPAVSANPTDSTVCESATATFTAAGNGSPSPTVQWQVSIDGGASFNDLPGETATTLSFAASAAQNSSKYRAVFTNTCSNAITAAATLTVNTAPTVATNPNSSTVCDGALASFNAAATSSPSPTVQWQVSTDGGTIFNDLSGETGTALSFTATTAQNGNKYRAVFTNSCSSATTAVATLTVDGFALSAPSQSFTFAGGNGSVDVITGSACSWTAISNDTFIHITSGSGGTGNGTVSFTVDPIVSGPRTGTMTVAGNTFTVNQNTPTATTGTIAGRIVDDMGQPVSGVVIQLSGTQNRQTITDALGAYHFDSVETAGFYIVTPARVNYSFSPGSRSFSQLGERSEAVFTALPTGGLANPLDTPEYFVRQHYLDFLGREPDESGFDFWSEQIISCGSDFACIERRRINVSAAYFLSIEFQQTGGLVDGLYRVSYGRRPLYDEFRPDTAGIAQNVIVGRGDWQRQLAANKAAFIDAFVQRAAFRSAYDNLTDDSFVNTLIANTGVNYSQSERDALVNGLTGGTLTRAAALRQVAENERFISAKFNQAFVMMQYFGYLRRDPDESGYQFWLAKLNQFNGNFEQAEMVKAFIDSGEYRARFPR